MVPWKEIQQIIIALVAFIISLTILYSLLCPTGGCVGKWICQTLIVIIKGKTSATESGTIKLINERVFNPVLDMVRNTACSFPY